jgi:hypothetical protein
MVVAVVGIVCLLAFLVVPVVVAPRFHPTSSCSWRWLGVINELSFSVCVFVSESTRSYDHSPDREIRYRHTRNPCVKGTVFPGYGNPIPAPVPGHTRDPILTVLPIPLLFLTDKLCLQRIQQAPLALMPLGCLLTQWCVLMHALKESDSDLGR